MIPRHLVWGFMFPLAAAFAQPSPRPTVTAETAARYLIVAESAGAEGARDQWRQRLDAARDTLESVLEWNNTHGQTGASLRMLAALGPFWSAPSIVSAYERAFAATVGADSVLRAKALNTAARVAFRARDQVKTRLWARESIAIAASLHDTAGIAVGYQRLVQAALRDADHPALRILADSGQQLCVRAHDVACEAYFVNMRGESARVLRAYDSALTHYTNAEAMYKRVSPPFRVDLAHNIGFALLAVGRSSDARARFVEGLQRAATSNNRRYVAFFLAGVASCEAVDGNMTNSAKLFGASARLLQELGQVADPADEVEYERYRSRARTTLGPIAFDAAVRAGHSLSVDSLVASIR
jgi:hypothetical protein